MLLERTVKTMKKTLLITLCLMLSFSALVGCSKTESPAASLKAEAAITEPLPEKEESKPKEEPKERTEPTEELQIKLQKEKTNEQAALESKAPLKLDSGLCAKALAHAKEMAAKGETFHSCGGAESVTGSTAGGKSIGLRSAAHATGLALDADRSRLGVGSVKVGDKQYTCVFAPRD